MALTLVLAMLGVVGPPAQAVGGYDNAKIADTALKYVGLWGGEACRDAGKLDANGTTVGGYGAGQCRTFVNCVVHLASGGTQYPAGGGGDYFAGFLNAGAAEITSLDDLRKGDVIQIGSGTHTFIIVSRVAGSTFNVVDSNEHLDEKVSNYNRTVALNSDSRAFRMGTVVASPTTAKVLHVKKTVGPDGAQQVYSASKNAVYESYWRPGGDGVHTSPVVNLPGTILDFDKVNVPGGGQTVFAAVDDGIYEVDWSSSQSPKDAKIINLAGTRRVRVDNVTEADGRYTHRLYVLATDGVYEYWWRDGGDGIHKQKLEGFGSVVTMVKSTSPSGKDEVFTVTPGAVYRTTWSPGAAPATNLLISISQNNIVDGTVVNVGNREYFYTAVTNGVWESSFAESDVPAGGQIGAATGKLLTTDSVVAVDMDYRSSDGVFQLYVGRGNVGVDEYWWKPYQGIHGNRLVTVNNLTAMDEDAGNSRIYIGHNGNLIEGWWNDSGVHTSYFTTLN